MTVGLEAYAIVNEVFGVSISECMEMDTLTFAKLQRDAVCHKLQQTKEGKEYLDKCYRYTQTSPDTKALHEHFNS